MTEPHVLVVTSAGASPAAVVPVLAALEAAGMRVRALDVGAAGGGGAGVADRVRRALLGETAERRLRREVDANPPDVAIAFDPHVAMVLTVARDQAMQPAPVIGVVGELEPSTVWGQTDCDRILVVDAAASVALTDAGVDGDRVVVVGPLGPRAYADAGAEDRVALRTRFSLRGRVVVVEVAGLGADATGQLALQLSLAPGADDTSFLFDASGDVDAAAVLRRQVPTLGLRAKLFGATGDAPLFWRAAEVVVARPRPEVVAQAMLVGARLVALIDDTVPSSAKVATAIEGRRRGVAARSLLLVSSALDAAVKGPVPVAAPDGADNVADIAWVIAGDRRAVIEERRSAARAATSEKVRTATQAAAAAARVTAMPGDLEDLGGGGGGGPSEPEAAVPDEAELARLRAEAKTRIDQATQSMAQARRAADEQAAKATTARAAGDTAAADEADRKAKAETTRMHGLLAELARLESELRELDRVAAAARDGKARAAAAAAATPPPKATSSVDDLLADLKRKSADGGPAPSASPPRSSERRTGKSGKTEAAIDDELAQLKRKMAETKRKP